jgi:hypothetical protein
MVISPELTEALERLEALSPMKCVVVFNDDQWDAAVVEMNGLGLRLASVSNAGLQGPYRRLTFLPEDAFTDAATPNTKDL